MNQLLSIVFCFASGYLGAKAWRQRKDLEDFHFVTIRMFAIILYVLGSAFGVII